MKEQGGPSGPWRATRGGIAAITVAVFLVLSARPAFAETASGAERHDPASYCTVDAGAITGAASDPARVQCVPDR